MKAKLKFDKTLILGFFAQHGEKILFGAVVLGSLFMVYLAMGGEKFDKTPDELSKKADRAKQKIIQADPTVEADVIDIGGLAETLGGDIEVEPYEFVRILDPPIHAPKTLRGEPVLLSVEQLRGKGGLGRFDRPGMGARGFGGQSTSEPLGRRWIVLTGVIDNEKLCKAYYDCFKNTQNHTDRDFQPEFQGFYVQRAEVNDEDVPVESLEWYQPYEDFWAEYELYRSSGDLVDRRFLDPQQRLVFPLPPRTDGQEWGKEIAHPPQIPLLGSDVGAPGQSPDEPEKETTPKDDPFGGTAGPARGPQGMAGLGGPGGRRAGPSMPMGGGMFDEGDMMGGYGQRMGKTGQNEIVPHLLFRFFDYNVKPGKRYRYKVQIVVTNPNFGCTPQDVVEEIRERMNVPGKWTRILRSPWSDPSGVVAVPRDDRLLAASVSPGRGTRDPVGEVMAIHWDYQTGDEIFDDFEIQRGWLANYLDQEMPNAEQQTGKFAGPAMGPEGGEMFGPMGPPPTGPAHKHKKTSKKKSDGEPESEKVNYRTEMLVVDLRGGDKLPGRNGLVSPGEILLLDPEGNFEVRDDAEDSQARKEQKNPTRSQTRRTSPGMLGPGGPRGPMGPTGGGGNIFED